MKLSPFFIAALLLASFSGCSKSEKSPAGTAATAATAEAPRAFGGRVAAEVHSSAVIEAINAETRLVTLRGTDGKVIPFTAGPDVRNFDQMKVGDKVDMFIKEDVIITVANLPNEPERTETVNVARAAKGEKPGAIITRRTRGVAVVDAIHYEARSATLRGAERTVDIVAGPEAVNFDKVKVGDRVFIESTETILIVVFTPPS
jgi:hypothetical protein